VEGAGWSVVRGGWEGDGVVLQGTVPKMLLEKSHPHNIFSGMSSKSMDNPTRLFNHKRAVTSMLARFHIVAKQSHLMNWR